MRIAANREGIGSRLKCIVSAMRLVKDVNVYWENTHCCRCRWNDLFENDIETNKNPHALKLDYPDVIYSWRFDITQEERQRTGIKRIDYLFDKTPEDIKQGILTQFKRLVPTKAVRRAVDSWKTIFNDKTVLSACIRSWWDVKGTTLERKFDINDIFKAVDENIIDRIFLTSDHEEVYSRFCQRYGKNKILYYPKRIGWGNWGTVEGIQDALIEMYLPGNAEKMILSWWSSYCECQWWMGGGKAKVYEVSKWK